MKDPAARAAAVQRYQASEAGKAKRAAYRRTAASKAAQARWRLTDGYKASQTRRREQHRDRYNARQAVYRAVKDGRLTRQPCHCGEPGMAHHANGYERRLDVIWLCATHHLEAHGGKY